MDIFDAAEQVKSPEDPVVSAMRQAVGTSPDEYAKHLDIANKTGLPISVVQADPESAGDEHYNNIDYNAALASVPFAKDWVRDNAPLISDDFSTPARLYRAINDIGTVYQNVGGNLAAGFTDLNAGLYGAAELAAKNVGAKGAGSWLEKRRKAATSFADAFAKQSMEGGFVARDIYQGIRSLGSSVPAMLMSIATGNPAPSLAVMGVQTGGLSGGEALDKGKSPLVATGLALSDGSIEVATGLLPLAKYLGETKAGVPFLKKLIHVAGLEVPGEQIATLAQDFNHWAVFNADKPFSTYLKQIPENAAHTLISTLVATGLQTGVMHVASGGLRERTTPEKVAEDIRAWNETVRGEKLYQRSQKAFGSLLDAITGDDRFYINAEAMQNAVATMPEESRAILFATLPDLLNDIETSTVAGQDISMRKADFTRFFSPLPQGDILSDYIKLDPSDMSFAENQAMVEAMQNDPTYAAQLQGDVSGALAPEEPKPPSHFEAVKRLFNKAMREGGLAPGEAGDASALVAAFLGNDAAQALGVVPMDFATQNAMEYQSLDENGRPVKTGSNFSVLLNDLAAIQAGKPVRLDEITRKAVTSFGAKLQQAGITPEEAKKLSSRELLDRLYPPARSANPPTRLEEPAQNGENQPTPSPQLSIELGGQTIALPKVEVAQGPDGGISVNIKPGADQTRFSQEPKTFYRGGDGGETLSRKMTAGDVIRYEREELGNEDVIPVEGIDLEKIPANELSWVTEKKEDAEKYRKEDEPESGARPYDAFNWRIIARDGDGGVLIQEKEDETEDERAALEARIAEAEEQADREAAQEAQQKTEETIKAIEEALPKIEETKADPEPVTPETEAKIEKEIEDFGEKIEGAKKDVWQKYRSAMSDPLPDDAKDITLSRCFPLPDYEALIAQGVGADELAVIAAMRDMIPAKPRNYRLRAWVEQLAMLRGLANDIINGKYTAQVLMEKADTQQFRGLNKKFRLYVGVGYPAFKSVKNWKTDAGLASIYRGKHYDKPTAIWHFKSPDNQYSEAYSSEEEMIAGLREAILARPDDKKTKELKFDVYRNTRTGEIIIGKKMGPGRFIDLKSGFKKSKEAFAYLEENADALNELFEKKRQLFAERRAENEPRVGPDYRGNSPMTPEKFMQEFGFRGVQFGNYVEQGRRALDLNDSYDALIDMASIIGVPSRAVSLNGTLGLAFGARGKGGKNAPMAHYEQEHTVINLTKSKGSGTIAHEWFHALDNYFGRAANGKQGSFAIDAPKGVRPEVEEAYNNLKKVLGKSEMAKRSILADNKRAKPYWATYIEMAARAYEAYIVHKAGEKGITNDYLANIMDEEVAAKFYEGLGEPNQFQYPLKAEMPAIVEAFDAFFATLKTEETEQGIRLYQTAPVFYSALQRGVEGAVQTNELPQDWIGIIKNLKGVKPEEIEWSGVNDWLKEQKGKVSKEQLLDYLRANDLEVKEVVKGAPVIQGESYRVEYNEENKMYGVLNKNGDVLEFFDREGPAEDWAEELNTGASDERGRDKNGETKYGSYTLPGGENYRELLLTLPEKWEPAPGGGTRQRAGFKSDHFDEPNIVAHIRFNDRNGQDGEKILHIEEIQSDWHQAGRKKGYKDAPRSTEGWTAEKQPSGRWSVADETGQWMSNYSAQSAEEAIKLASARTDGRVPDAPFKTSWPELAFKRALRYAVENGYDKVTWTTGEQQVERYDLSKQVKEIEYIKRGDKYELAVTKHDGEGLDLPKTAYSAAELEDVVGKEVAKKIVDGEGAHYRGHEGRTLEGLDLKVGGEGMKGFYDNILPKMVNKLVKKWGGKVGESELYTPIDAGKTREENTVKVHSLDITPSMREAVMGGLPLFQTDQGYTQFSPAAAGDFEARLRHVTTAFTKSKNYSTAAHEFSHWATAMHRLFAQEARKKISLGDTNPELQKIVADWESLKKGIGATDDNFTADQEEVIARKFEVYVRDGHAPSERLRRVFARYMGWLVRIYKDIRGLGGEISPEIRGVFDRWLATSEEIDSVKGKNASLIKIAQALGLSQDIVATVADYVNASIDMAKEKVYSKLAAQQKAYESSAYKRELAAMKKLVEKDFKKAKAWAAVTYLEENNALLYVGPETEAILGEPTEYDVPEYEGESLTQEEFEQLINDTLEGEEREQGRRRMAKALMAKPPKEPRRLLDFLKSRGGLRDDGMMGGDLKAIGVPEWLINNKKGMYLDDARRAAIDEGFLDPMGDFDDFRPSESTINDLLEALTNDVSGWAVYSSQDGAEVAEYQARMDLEEAADKEGVTDRYIARVKREMKKERARYGNYSHLFTTNKNAYGAIEPDFVAERLGYASGEEMIREIRVLPVLERAVDKEARNRLLDMYPDMIAQGRIHDEALTEIQNDKTLLALEALISEVGKQGGKNRASLKQFATIMARQQIAKMKMGEVNYRHRFDIARERETKAALMAANKGDAEAALIHLQRSMVNHIIDKQLEAFQETMKKAQRLFDKVEKKDKDLAVSKDMEFIGAARFILFQNGLGGENFDVKQWLEDVERENPAIRDSLVNLEDMIGTPPKNAKELTVAEFMEAYNAIKEIYQIAHNAKENEIEGRNVENAQAVVEIEAAMKAAPPLSGKIRETALDRFANMFIDVDNALTRMQDFATRIGGVDGPMHKYIVRPLVQACDEYVLGRNALRKKFIDICNKYPDIVNNTKKIATEFVWTVNGESAKMEFDGMLHLMGFFSHRGNASSFDKLTNGFGMEVEDFIKAQQDLEDRGVLTEQHWKFMQELWDLMAEVKPMAYAVHKKIYGYRPDEIDPQPFMTTWGMVKGGYWPAIADRKLTTNTVEKEPDDQTGTKTTRVFQGMFKKRVKNYTEPLICDLRLGTQHLDQMARFIYIEPAAQQVRRLFSRRDFKDAMKRYYNAYENILKPWYARSITQVMEPLPDATDDSTKAGRWLLKRVNGAVTSQIMKYNIKVALQNFANMGTVLVHVGPRPLAKAFARYVASPIDAVRFAVESSPMLKDRLSRDSARLSMAIDEILNNRVAFSKARNAANLYGDVFMKAVDHVVCVVTWHAAYNEHLKKQGKDASHEDAVYAADNAVLETQGSFAPQYSAKFEASHPVMKMLIPFYSFFNSQYNLLGTKFSGIMRKHGWKGSPLMFGAFFAYTLPAALLGQFIVDALTARLPDDDDRDGEVLDDWLAWAFKAEARYVTLFIPVVGAAGNVAVNLTNKNPTDDRVSFPAMSAVDTAVRLGKNTAKEVGGKDVRDSRMIQDAFATLGIITNLPLGQPSKPISYVVDVEQGKSRPKTPLNYMQGLVAGPPPKKK